MSWYNPTSWLTKAEAPEPRAAPVKLDLAAATSPPLGTTGLRRFGGWIEEELHVKLAGRRGALVYREMADNDATVGAILYAIEALLRQAVWRVEPRNETPRAKEAAEFLEECLADMQHTWDELLSEVLSMLPFGWAFFETVYKIRADGKVGLRKISIRSQDTLDRWEFDGEGQVLGMWQSDPYVSGARLVFLPMSRALLFRATSRKASPEGRSVLRNAYRSWFFAKRIQEIEAIGVERDLTGLPIVHLPPEFLAATATAEQKASATRYKTLVQQIRRDEREGIVMPSEVDREGKPTGYKLSLLATGGRRAIDTSAIITRNEQAIARSLLAEFQFLGTTNAGSYSLADSKTALFATALGAHMESIAETFNRHFVPRLMGLNGFTREEYPKMVYGDLEQPALAETALFVNQLVNAGVLTPDKALERKMREMGSLPQAAEDALDFVPGAPTDGAPATATAGGPLTAPQVATEAVAAVALNGAQVQAAQGIVQAVADKHLPRDTGVQMLVAFFGLSAVAVERIMGEVGRGFEQSKPDAPPAAPP